MTQRTVCVLGDADRSGLQSSSFLRFRRGLCNDHLSDLEGTRFSLLRRHSTLLARLQALQKLKEQAQAAALTSKTDDTRLAPELRWEILRLDHDIDATNKNVQQCAQNVRTLNSSLMFYSAEPSTVLNLDISQTSNLSKRGTRDVRGIIPSTPSSTITSSFLASTAPKLQNSFLGRFRRHCITDLSS